MQNPLLNALAASAYIGLISLFVMTVPDKQPIMAAAGPVVFLSLFVFSAAVMGYLFLLQPALLALSGKPKEGVSMFVKTLLWFGAVSLVVIGIYALAIYI